MQRGLVGSEMCIRDRYHMGNTDVINKIDEMLMSKSEKMRASAIYILRKLNLREKKVYIDEMVHDSSSLVKKNLIKAFYKFKDLEKLTVLANDTDVEIAELAREYIGRGM
eukprot:TRINITY_DN8933_c0_g1_i1.p3 TRINITY_DN8933_c0_g1~~TRINITY_DN8933_c0_g1_i1.p3  ORF type:complete len:110 (+),score=28.04 TRINITY_DN8933_c0_g1_i1:112-441(+)